MKESNSEFLHAKEKQKDRSFSGQEKKEGSEELKEKILGKIEEMYKIQPEEILTNDRESWSSPDTFTENFNHWGEKVGSYSEDRPITVRQIFSEAMVVGSDVFIMDVNKYGTGKEALDKFIHDHPGGKLISWRFYEKRTDPAGPYQAGSIDSYIIFYDKENLLKQ